MDLNRRDVLKGGVFASAAVAIPVQRQMAGAPSLKARMPTSRLPKPFTVPFTQPPIAVPVRKGSNTDYYRIRMQQVQAEILPGFRTPVFAYNGTVPGPTIKATRGRRVVGRFVNSLPAKHPTLGYVPWTAVHLHGHASQPQFDGYANDISLPGQYKDYIYENNQQARSIWYHDHGFHHTAENVYHGLLGSYHITDALEQRLPLPKGEFDVQLSIGDAMFNSDGTLLFSLDNDHGMYGDVNLVNGRPWPVMKVKRRKYRFRMLAATVSRSFEWWLDSGDPFTVVGTDGGLMPKPQTVSRFRHSSGERYDVVIDFARHKPGTRIVLRNISPKHNEDFVNTDVVMAFDVVGDAFDPSNNEVPAVLNPGDPTMALRASQAKRTREFKLGRSSGVWHINDQTWDDVIKSGFQKVMAEPKHDDIEIWEFKTGGGWFHPMHIHLADFQVLSRDGKGPFPFEAGPKDVVYVGPSERVRVLVHFEGAGKYMIHCHNVVHEDHDMMVQYRVVNPGKEIDPLSVPAQFLPEKTPL